jgi:excisionase family DNA binding protein
MEKKKFETMRDGCERLRLSRATMYKLIASGDIRTARSGRAVRILSESIDRYMDRCLERGNQPTGAE